MIPTPIPTPESELESSFDSDSGVGIAPGLRNGWTDWHQMWYMSADSSGNGHMLNTIRPSIPPGAIWGGGFRGSQIQKSGQIVKRLDGLEPNLVHVGSFVWEWTKARCNLPHMPVGILGGFMGSQMQVWESCQTAGPIGTQFGICLWIHLGMYIG